MEKGGLHYRFYFKYGPVLKDYSVNAQQETFKDKPSNNHNTVWWECLVATKFGEFGESSVICQTLTSQILADK